MDIVRKVTVLYLDSDLRIVRVQSEVRPNSAHTHTHTHTHVGTCRGLHHQQISIERKSSQSRLPWGDWVCVCVRCIASARMCAFVCALQGQVDMWHSTMQSERLTEVCECMCVCVCVCVCAACNANTGSGRRVGSVSARG